MAFVLDPAEKAVVQKIGDEFIAALPALINDEIAKLPAGIEPFVAPIVALVIPVLTPGIQAWFDKLVA